MEDLKFKLDDKIGITLKEDKVLLHGINDENKKMSGDFRAKV